MKQEIDFKIGTDTGEADATATRPINNGDLFNAATLGRPDGNLRQRTEVLRSVVNQHGFLADADRSLMVLLSPSFATVNLSWDAGGQTGALTASDDIILISALTPGATRGGPGAGVGAFSSILASLTLWDTATEAASQNGLLITAQDWAFTGSNEITVDVILDETVPSSPVVTVTGEASVDDAAWQPGRDNVTITINSSHTYADIVSAVAGNATANALILCTWVAGDVAGGADTDAFNGADSGQLAGGLDGEHHRIASAELAAFFAASTENRLGVGDTLAIYYPSLTDRRRALSDIPRTGGSYADIPAASLVNLSREPSKAANCLPIGKLWEDGYFVFCDGTRLAPNIDHGFDTTTESLRAVLSSPAGSATVGHQTVSGSSTTVRAFLRDIVEPVTDAASQYTTGRRFSMMAGDSGPKFYYIDVPARVGVLSFVACARATNVGKDVRRSVADVNIQAGVSGSTPLASSTLYYVYSTASGVVALTAPVTAATGDALLGWFETPSALGSGLPPTNMVSIDHSVGGPTRKGLVAYTRPTSVAGPSDPTSLWISPGYFWLGGEVFYVAQATQIKSDLSSSGSWVPGCGIVAGQYGFLYAQVTPNPSSSTRSVAQPISAWRLDTAPPDADGTYNGWPCIGIVRCSGVASGFLDGGASYPDGSVVALNAGGNPLSHLPRLSDAVADFALLEGEHLTDVDMYIQGGTGALTLAMPYSTAQPYATPGEPSPFRMITARQDSTVQAKAPIWRVDVAASSVTAVFVQGFRYTRVYGAQPTRW